KHCLEITLPSGNGVISLAFLPLGLIWQMPFSPGFGKLFLVIVLFFCFTGVSSTPAFKVRWVFNQKSLSSLSITVFGMFHSFTLLKYSLLLGFCFLVSLYSKTTNKNFVSSK